VNLQITAAEKMLALSITFTFLLLGARVIYAHELTYIFYVWNLFLAIIPVWFAGRLRKRDKIDIKSLFIMACWLVFFPNAPYVITDIFHFHQRPGVPLWYDLLLVLSAAWSGLMAGFISLHFVDGFLHNYAGKKWRVALTLMFLFAASAGIYIGRFLRLNSWNVVTKPFKLVRLGINYTFNPFDHTEAWGFCIACTIFLALLYYSKAWVKAE